MSGVIISLVLAGAVALQDPAALIEKLRDEDISVRERAMAELEKLGAAAEPALKKVVGDRDAHVADCARRLLRIIELDRAFSPALKEALPGLARRLAFARGEEWTTTYLSLNKPGAHPQLTREDLAPLAEEAIRGALTPEAKREACETAVGWFHRNARPALIGLLKDPDKDVRYRARRSLEELFGNDATGMIVAHVESEPALFIEALGYGSASWGLRVRALIAHPDPLVSGRAIEFLARRRMVEALPDIREALKAAPADTKIQALEYFRRIKSRETIETLGPLLTDSSPEVRYAAVSSLDGLRIRLDESAWRRLLADSDSKVVGEALRELSPTDGRKLLPEIRELARHSSRDRAWPALAALRRCKDPDLPDILFEVFKRTASDDQAHILHYLNECDPGKVALPLRSILEDASQTSEVRRAAFRTLNVLKSSPSNDWLMALVRGNDPVLAADVAFHLRAAGPDLIRPEIPRLVENSPSSIIRIHDWGVDDYSRYRFVDGTLELLRLADPLALSRVLAKVIRESESDGSRAARALVALRLVSAVPELRALLDPENPRMTIPATWALAQLKAVEARPDFIKLLKSQEEEIRAAAATALGVVGLDSAVQELRLLTRDPVDSVRHAAVDSLVQHRVVEAIPDLVRLLDESSDASDRAAAGLLELGSDDHLTKMLEWISSGSSRQRDLAKKILAVMAPTEAGPVVARMLDHRDSEIRAEGIWLAHVLGLRELRQKLLEGLGEPGIARGAREAIVGLDLRDLIPDLRSMVQGADCSKRMIAIDALAELGDTESAPAIRRLLDHPDEGLRRAAITAAGQLRDREAAPTLIKLLQHPDRDVQNYSAAALVEMGESAPVDVIITLLKDPFLPFWHPVWDLIVQHRPAELVPCLRGMLKDSSKDYFGPIARCLAALGAKEAIPDLIKLVEEGEEDDEAPAALVKLQAIDALPVLRRAWNKSRDYRYSRIAEAMADLGDPSALENPRSDNPEDARQAARILCLRGDRRGVPEVLKMAESSPEVLSVLNAVRNPGGWRALAGRPWRGRFSGCRKYVIARLAALADLKVVWTKGASFEELTWPVQWTFVGRFWGPSSLLKEIVGEITGENVLTCGSGDPDLTFNFVLDSDSIRILPHRDALAFWKQWWADEQGKKK